MSSALRWKEAVFVDNMAERTEQRNVGMAYSNMDYRSTGNNWHTYSLDKEWRISDCKRSCNTGNYWRPVAAEQTQSALHFVFSRTVSRPQLRIVPSPV